MCILQSFLVKQQLCRLTTYVLVILAISSLMRLHRFIIEQELRIGLLTIIDSNFLHQISSVLRMRSGAEIILLDGKGHAAHAVIQELYKSKLIVDITSIENIPCEPEREIILCSAVLKRENFEWVIEKATELGAMTIVPILAERTIKTGLKMERLVRIAREAVEQCGRGNVPTIHEPMTLDDALKFVKDVPRKIFCHPPVDLRNSKNTGVHCSHISTTPLPKKIACFIGPEGGWTEKEVDLASEFGCEVLGLTSLTLRAETAAIIAVHRAVEGLL